MGELAITDIIIGDRHRKDLGDIKSLAGSINRVGLLHAIVVTPGNVLIAGERRLAACKELGWTAVPVRVVDLDEIVKGEFAENADRKDFRPSEIDAIRRAMEPKVAAPIGRPSKEKVETFHLYETGKTRDKIGAFAGISGRTVEKIKAVVEAAEKDPDKFRPLVDEMDRTGKVDGAYKKLKQEERHTAAVTAAPEPVNATVTDNQSVIRCDALITDPPYGILNEPWEPKELEGFTREWLSRWNECEAKCALVFWSQRHLWEGRVWLDEELSNYEFRQLLVWHYPNNKSPQSRLGFKQTWEPIFFYRHRGSEFKVGVSDANWGNGLNDFDCHVAAVPQSNFNESERKVHPAQKPVSVFRWLINAVTNPGEIVCDPFSGSGTSGIAAVQLGRKYHGIEIGVEYLKAARERIGAYGSIVRAA